ncbi:hypothetical protein HRD49_21710 [Corallococcus exiguus]|uniref:hypothetical protein n=1 Tax=Corallococcus TaxID=83461 RepID=UPI000EA1F26D|nr:MULTISPECIES: hypothetical protein [Corallococcus]NNC16760.1 hypothetical protein [Corallococcus exiguus]NRD53714.1 hypothetical protein [Corallococcus exiguus]NRD64373.1 hypothetical protein [Corallococcus exiguus]RKH26979.1 hypothetical protein D7V77_12810 [Corallococcus sp. CA041A]RKI12158.1 hypothetical protein D7Y15_19085 [Corallococcus sp. AB030]
MAAIVESERAGIIPAVPGSAYKLSWGAIFGGTFVALGVWILLYTLGLALGLSSVNPADAGSAKSAGIFTGIWSVLVPLVALFVGGVVAARSAGIVDKAGGAMHGAVLWGLTTLMGVLVLGMVLSSVLGAVFNVGKAAVGAGGTAAVGAVTGGGEAAKAFGLDANDALAPVNQRLRQEGKPTITANQLEAATKDIVTEGVRQGRMDRELLVSNIAQNTKLSRQDAEGVADRVEQQVDQAKTKASELGQQAQQGALKVADRSGRVFWGIFAGLLLGLVAAVLGATLGVSRKQRIRAEGAVVVPPTTPTTPGPRREVYP